MPKRPKLSFWIRHGLSLVLLLLFLFSLGGQFLAGWHVYNERELHHGLARVDGLTYLQSGHFIESTFENWESEFLQMAIFVWLTVFLFQWGSAESNPLPGEPKHEPKYPRRYFLSVAALIVLSIFLRQKDSSQSKPVDAPMEVTKG